MDIKDTQVMDTIDTQVMDIKADIMFIKYTLAMDIKDTQVMDTIDTDLKAPFDKSRVTSKARSLCVGKWDSG